MPPPTAGGQGGPIPLGRPKGIPLGLPKGTPSDSPKGTPFGSPKAIVAPQRLFPPRVLPWASQKNIEKP